MIKEMAVEELTRFAEGHGAALEELRAKNCTALPCLPCCCPSACISLVRAGSPSAGKLLRDDSSVFLYLPSQDFGAHLMQTCSCWRRAAWQTLLCTWLRVQCPKSAVLLCLQYLLHSEQSQQQVPFGAKCRDLVLGTHQSWYKKRRIWHVS